MKRWPAIFFLFSAPLAGCVIADSPNRIERGDFGIFKRSLNTESYGYQLVVDPVGKFSGRLVERFEVRSGDCSSNTDWSDCRNDRERSEVREVLSQEDKNATSWYGWDFYVPPDWTNIFPTKTVVGQFHQNKSHPVWMFLQQTGGLYLDDQSSGFSTRKILLIPADEFTGHWHRVEVQARWATDESGFINVYVNEKKVFEHQGRTMTAGSVYFRYGVYRSFLSRYRAASNSETVPTQIAYFTNVRKSKTQMGLR